MIPVLLSGLVVFITHALEAVTGFGCTVLALPFVSALLGVREAVQVLTVIAWILALYLAVTKRRDIDFKQFFLIAGCMVCGLPVGMYLFRSADIGFLRLLLALFIVLSSALQLLKLSGAVRPGNRMPKLAAVALLFCAGIVHGMFSSGGPLVVLYAAAAMPEKGKFRATLCLLWTTLNTIIIGSYFVRGEFETSTVTTVGWMLPFLLAGIIAGEKIHNRVNARVFSFTVFSMLLATGIFMIAFR